MDSDESRDVRWMGRAHELSLRGWGRTAPNPLVGAAVVRDGQLAGEGWHAEFGGEHAEAAALRAAGLKARGGTLYVTLEPCNHTGKQPPCVDAILAAGVARVVIAVRDPNPVAAGGLDRLRAAGIVVDVGVSADEARRINFRFLHRFAEPSRPLVAVKLAVSMDGMIADASGESRWLSSEPAREWVHWLRAGFGAIAVGGTTAMHDAARLTVRGSVVPRTPPRRVVFDRNARLSADAALFQVDDAGQPVVVVASTTQTDRRDALTAVGGDVIVADTLDQGLRALAARGIDSVLVEGGGRLAGALLDADVVHRVYQLQCPLWFGRGTPAWSGLAPRTLASAPRWKLAHTQGLGDDVVIELARD